ncbi:flagellin N-terminal-like domain-containing protein [Halogranum gelatinilyticum]|uniref:Flagellin N-terminal-like domain-containing protein n=1 Tax=Halogranum gelatinilyticum TaxID=660521 RepID=A0A1G9XC59_9EURY|nr:type IV pilin N-terminal domain-containing protein [Halogranum gelatinilyticum]SDM94340.1 flagellin N-terminal-like domain-containing protein [Halogranum gelatinilyticum]
MKFNNLFNTDDRAVSPVIGVILMVAITVILAAVIGTFVLGLGDSVSDTSPQASLSFDYTADAADSTIEVTHSGGDAIPESATLTLNSDVAALDTTDELGSELTVGDTRTVGIDAELETGDTLNVIVGDRIVASWTYQG